MAVSDQIEKVNRKMFEKLKSRNDNLAVFFCKYNSVNIVQWIYLDTYVSFKKNWDIVLFFQVAEKDCKQCPPVLQELENIDDEAEAAGSFHLYIDYNSTIDINPSYLYSIWFNLNFRYSNCEIRRQNFS